MKITFILPGFSRFPVGGFQIVYHYANYLAKKGYDVQIVHAMFLPTQPIPNTAMLAKYQVKQMMAALGLFKPWFKFDQRVSVINKGKLSINDIRDADRVIATAWETAEFVSQLPRKCGKKYYFIQHYEIWGGKSRVDATWKLPLHKIVIATWLKNKAIEFGETADLVPNFVEHQNFYLTENIKDRKSVVSMLYSEHAVKGSKDGIEALRLIKNKYKNVQIKLFGVFNQPKNLPDGTEYYKNPSRQTLRDEIYNKSAIYVFPSVSEGWGLTATEAMACGAALCSTNNGGVDDFGFEGESALISPVKSPKELFNNIDRLLANSELRINLAQNGKEIVDQLTLDNSGALFERAIMH